MKYLIIECTLENIPLCSAHQGTPNYAAHITKYPIMHCTARNMQLCSAHHEHLIKQCTSQNTQLHSAHYETPRYSVFLIWWIAANTGWGIKISHFSKRYKKWKKLSRKKVEYISEKYIKNSFLMGFKNQIRHISAVVGNTLLKTFPEVLHHSLG